MEVEVPSAAAFGSPVAIANPYPFYRALRERSPLRYVRVPAGAHSGLAEPVYSFALLKYDDVLGALKDPATYSSFTLPALGSTFPRLGLLHDDPPRHTHLRRLVNKAFQPTRIAALAGFVTAAAQQLIDSIRGPSAELISALAIPLPMRVIAHLLGIPGEDYPSYKSWSEAIANYVGVTLEKRQLVMKEMMRYFAAAIAARRTSPRDDLLTALVQAEAEGASLSDEEIIRFAATLLFAGNETTTNLIGNMLGILADRPELYAQARADRSLVEPIIEETLRFESPAQRLMRLTTRKTTVGEIDIPEGQIVDVVFGAANRDPAVFADPDSFLIDRPTKEHLGFGHGTHFCLGAPLARLEAKIALNVLLDRYKSIGRGQGSAVRQTAAMFSFGYSQLPLLLAD